MITIQDLDYQECNVEAIDYEQPLMNLPNHLPVGDIQGGGFNFSLSSIAPIALTSAIAIALPGTALASSQALALGQTAITSTQNYTRTIVDSNFSMSFAYSQATAIASTPGRFAYSRSDALAFSISSGLMTANLAASTTLQT